MAAITFAVAAGGGIPAAWILATLDRENQGDLPLVLAIIMVGGWVGFGAVVRRWRAIPVTVAAGVVVLVIAQILSGPTDGDTGPSGPLLFMVFLPVIAACVAIGVSAGRRVSGRR